MRKKTCVEIVQESVEVCTKGMPAEPFMRSILSLRIFTSLPDSRLRFFIVMHIQYSY